MNLPIPKGPMPKGIADAERPAALTRERWYGAVSGHGPERSRQPGRAARGRRGPRSGPG